MAQVAVVDAGMTGGAGCEPHAHDGHDVRLVGTALVADAVDALARFERATPLSEFFPA